MRVQGNTLCVLLFCLQPCGAQVACDGTHTIPDSLWFASCPGNSHWCGSKQCCCDQGFTYDEDIVGLSCLPCQTTTTLPGQGTTTAAEPEWRRPKWWRASGVPSPKSLRRYGSWMLQFNILPWALRLGLFLALRQALKKACGGVDITSLKSCLCDFGEEGKTKRLREGAWATVTYRGEAKVEKLTQETIDAYHNRGDLEASPRSARGDPEAEPLSGPPVKIELLPASLKRMTFKEYYLALGYHWPLALFLAVSRCLLWHLLQVFLYFLAFACYWDVLDPLQLVLGGLFCCRQVLYVVGLIIATCRRPAFLLFHPVAAYEAGGRWWLDWLSYVVQPEMWVVKVAFVDADPKPPAYVAIILMTFISDLFAVAALVVSTRSGALPGPLVVCYSVGALSAVLSLCAFWKTDFFTESAAELGKELVQHSLEAGVPAENLRMARFSAQELERGGYSAGDTARAGYSADELKRAGVAADHLFTAGYTASDLWTGGYSVEELREAYYHTSDVINDLKTAGHDAQALRAAGFTVRELRGGGFTAKDLKDAGFLAGYLRAGGFPGQDLVEAGYPEEEVMMQGLAAAGHAVRALRAAGFDANELKAEGFTSGQLRDGGFAAKDLAVAGYTFQQLRRGAGFSTEQLVEVASALRRGGFSADGFEAKGWDSSCLKDAGYTAQDLAAAGYAFGQLYRGIDGGVTFSMEQLIEVASALRRKGFSADHFKAAGWEAGALREAGHTAQDLAVAGYSFDQLRFTRDGGAGFSLEQLIGAASALRRGGFSAHHFKAAGWEASFLKDAGYTAQDLAVAGYSSSQLFYRAIFSREQLIEVASALRRGGSSADHFKATGWEASALREAGYTAQDLAEAGYTAQDLAVAGYSRRDMGVHFSEAQLVEVASSLRRGASSADHFKAAGWEAGALREAGYTAQDLAVAGYTAQDLAVAGYPFYQLHFTHDGGADFSTEQLIEAISALREGGFSADRFKAAGWWPAFLRGAGYTEEELQAAGYD